MGVTQYIGARYVPIFADPAEWTRTRTYEPLTIVLHEGNSFTSKQFVPVGIDINNDDFWAETGNYNAQVEAYRQEVMRNDAKVDEYTKYFDEIAFSFNTVADMKNSELLYNGAICHTNGFRSVDDGGAAWYEIVNTGTANEMDVIACGDLFAILIPGKNTLTPEIFGAYGDDEHYDDVFISRMLEYAQINLGKQAKAQFNAGKTYKVEFGITIPSYIEVEGNNCLVKSDSVGIRCDGLYHTQIRNFKLETQSHAIELTSTSYWCNYNIFENIFAINVASDHMGSYGIYIHNTGNYITEETFDHIVCWHYENGIRCDNDGVKSLGTCFFIRCSTELSEVYGQFLRNASDMTFLFTRMVETKSNIFKTEESCQHLSIYAHTTNVSNNWELSDNTNGIIFGFYRMGGIYETDPGMICNIVKGAVIPFSENLKITRTNIPNTGATIPSQDGAQIYTCFNHLTTTGVESVKLTLDPRYFGGTGKVNSFIIHLNSGSVVPLEIECGNWSYTINVSDVGTLRDFKFEYNYSNNSGHWSINKLVYSISDL